MSKKIIQTHNAPEAVGPYSQAVKIDNTKYHTVYLSGQIALDPNNSSNPKHLLSQGIKAQATQVFDNLSQVAKACGGELKDIVKLNIYLTNMADYPILNQIMSEFMHEPFPARAAVCVKELPLGAIVEADAVMVI